jgi:hypothetical protein
MSPRNAKDLFVHVGTYEKIRLIEVEADDLIEGADGNVITFGRVCGCVECDGL